MPSHPRLLKGLVARNPRGLRSTVIVRPCFLFLLGLLASPPTLAEDKEPSPPQAPALIVRIPEARLSRDRPWSVDFLNEEGQGRWALKCDPSLKVEVQLETSIFREGACPRNTLFQTVKVQTPEGQVWLEFQRSVSEEQAPLPSITLACQEHMLQLSAGATFPLVLRLNPGEAPSVTPSLEKELRRRLSAPAGEYFQDAQELDTFLSAVLPGLNLENEPVRQLLSLARLYRAREQLAANDWARIEFELEWDPRHLSERPGRSEAERAVMRELERQRHLSQPLQVRDLRIIDTLTSLDHYSVAPAEQADIFWKKDRLCVTSKIPGTSEQSHQMRCFDTVTRRWGREEPARAPDPAHAVREAGVSCGGSCATEWGCLFLPEERRAIASTEGGWNLLVGGRGSWSTQFNVAADDPDLTGRPHPVSHPRLLSAREVSAEVLRGAGGPVLGAGHYLVSAHGDIFIQAGERPRGWHLFPNPPAQPEKGEWQQLIVSPDQRYVAALSADPDSYHKPTFLWLARIVPVSTH